MKILKKIGSIALDALIVMIFIISLLVVVASITANRQNGQANVFGYTVNSVQTDSMAPSINAGDLVVSKLITADNKAEIVLEKGQIVSFYDELENGMPILITHRIDDIKDEGGTLIYTTWGDNRVSAPIPDDPMTINEIQSVCLFRIPFAGRFIDFLKTPLGFILCLVLPLLGFIAWQAYKLVSLYLKSKKLELEEEAEKISKTKSELSEEEKNAIIAEYLAKQAKAEQEQGAKPAEQKTQASKADASRSNTAQKSQGAQPKKQNNASGNKRKGKR